MALASASARSVTPAADSLSATIGRKVSATARSTSKLSNALQTPGF